MMMLLRCCLLLVVVIIRRLLGVVDRDRVAHHAASLERDLLLLHQRMLLLAVLVLQRQTHLVAQLVPIVQFGAALDRFQNGRHIRVVGEIRVRWSTVQEILGATPLSVNLFLVQLLDVVEIR